MTEGELTTNVQYYDESNSYQTTIPSSLAGALGVTSEEDIVWSIEDGVLVGRVGSQG